MAANDELSAPLLLLAMPQVLDPFFFRSVVLLASHDEEGSFGIIVNRPANLKVQEILDDLSIAWRGDAEAAAFVGGPVQPQRGMVLFHREDDLTAAMEETSTQVSPGLYLTQHVANLEVLAQSPPSTLRLLLGYAGWGSGQLLTEVQRHDWLTAPVDLDLVFSANPEEVWEIALGSVGIDPAALPSWTSDDGAAN